MPYRGLKQDPLGVPRNPLAVYLLAVALLSGVLTLCGVHTSAAIEKTLPPVAQVVWGLLLTGGAASTLTGMYWQGKITTGLLLKRLGMFVLGVSSAVLALVAVVGYGFAGLLSGLSYLGFSLACGLQYHRLNTRVRAIIAVTKNPLLLPVVSRFPLPPQDSEEDPP